MRDFLQAGCPFCHPPNSVKALKGRTRSSSLNFLWLQFLSCMPWCELATLKQCHLILRTYRLGWVMGCSIDEALITITYAHAAVVIFMPRLANSFESALSVIFPQLIFGNLFHDCTQTSHVDNAVCSGITGRYQWSVTDASRHASMVACGNSVE